MPTLEDIPVSLTPEELIDSHGQNQVRPSLLRDAEEAIALPGGHYWVPVIDGAVEDGHVREEVAAL